MLQVIATLRGMGIALDVERAELTLGVVAQIRPAGDEAGQRLADGG